jgi:hypothetical protein
MRDAVTPLTAGVTRSTRYALIGVSTDACRRSLGEAWGHGRGLPERGLKRLKPLTEPERRRSD